MPKNKNSTENTDMSQNEYWGFYETIGKLAKPTEAWALAMKAIAAATSCTAVIVLIQGNPFQQPTALVSMPILCVVTSPDKCERLP
ncbi:MAG: hypothetical protein WCK65_16095 [Rhodospirillaceae bacterium]